MSTGQVKFMARLLMNNPEVGSNELLAHFVCSLKEGTHSGLDDVAARLLYIGNSELPPNHLAAFAKAVVSASYTTLMSVRRLEYPESYFVSIIKNIFQALKGVGVGGQATVVMTSRNFDGAALADRTAGVRLGAGEKPTGTNSPDPTYFSSSSTSPELPPSQTMLTPHPPRTADVRLGPSEKPTSTNTPDPAYSSSSSASPELSPSQTKLTPNPLQTSQAPDILKCPDCDYIPGPGELGHRRSNLARHKRGHLGIMYQCPLCSREYTRTDNLRKHWINKHGENT
ncbi:MAG: hypothetical protein M1840_006462 [Geoglossum simile]|nr:MAG: hypothetical protein M1840_006462 [Geoglossum simile]